MNPWLRPDGRIYPGAAIGVLGSGQLGRMFAIAARRMGYRVHTYSPESDTPTGQVSDVEINAPYEDLDKVRAFARNVSAVHSNSKMFRPRQPPPARNARALGPPAKCSTPRSTGCARRIS